MLSKVIEAPVHFIHKNLLWFLLGLYVAALVLPAPGLWIRSQNFGHVTWVDGSQLQLTLPVFMLSFLLFNAGLGTRIQELRNLKKNPSLLLVGILANTLIPLLYIALFQVLGQHWHNKDELQHILMGLALVVAMPIAGSSTAWSQNVNGNLALSLGLVVFSTILSPWTTPFVLHAIGFLTSGDYSEDLHELARTGTGAFLSFSVVLPSLLGIGARQLLGEDRIKPFHRYLKLFNLINLLALSYSNAAISLPQAFVKPDWDFLTLIMLVTSCLCLIAFGTGWLISRLYKTSQAEQSALMFGLGMNNNGTGLVLSSMALADHPLVMLPIIFYNLFQQIIAGIVDAKVTRDNRYL
jgi:BASS family bile acid:Na+ symporter